MQLGKIKRNFLLKEILNTHLQRELRKLQRKYEPLFEEIFKSQERYIPQFSKLERKSLNERKCSDLYTFMRVKTLSDPQLIRDCQQLDSIEHQLKVPQISIFERQFDFTVQELEQIREAHDPDKNNGYVSTALTFTSSTYAFSLFFNDLSTSKQNRLVPEWAEKANFIVDPNNATRVLIFTDGSNEAEETLVKFNEDLKRVNQETCELGMLAHEFLTDAKTLKQVTDNWPSLTGLIPDHWFQEEERRRVEAEEQRKHKLIQEQLSEAKKLQGRKTTGELLESKLRSTIGARRLRGN